MSRNTRHIVLLLALAGAAPAVPAAQTREIAVDPIRCWWRTSAGAVRTGETFSVVLTCATLETEAVQVVPDESRLASNAVQVAPFEIVGGSHPEDMRTADRRFFQYEYRLRMINPDYIGRDVPLPELVLHYRINSRVSGNTAVQGRDQTYIMPPGSVRVLSMVPADAPDIRDTSDELFTVADGLRFRARMLQIAAVTLIVLGSLMIALALVRLVQRSRRQRAEAQAGPTMSLGALLRLAGRELTAVQRETDASGWTEALVTRALAAARIVAASALGRAPSQRLVDRPPDADLGAATWDGAIARRKRRGRDVVVSSAVTSHDLATKLAVLPASASADSRELLTQLQSALTSFTAAQYAREASLDRGALDQALTNSLDAVRALKSRYAWPTLQLRRWLGRPVDVG
jgi:hypothetical protein